MKQSRIEKEMTQSRISGMILVKGYRRGKGNV